MTEEGTKPSISAEFNNIDIFLEDSTVGKYSTAIKKKYKKKTKKRKKLNRSVVSWF